MNWNDCVEFIKTVAVISIPIIEYFGLKKFNDAYMKEKGKNLATKEDIQDLTALTEEVKVLYQTQQYRYEHIYDIKKEVIQESLDVLDDYLSWLNYDNGNIPIRKRITEEDLTFRARKCYNELVLTCESNMLPELFLKIIFDEKSNTMELYNAYRNESRKEMGLEMELDLSKESIFISRVSTKDLSGIE